MLHFLKQDAIQLINILLYIALWFFNSLQDAHVLFNDINNFIDVVPVLWDEGFFLLQNDFDKILMVTANPVNIVCVFHLYMLVGL